MTLVTLPVPFMPSVREERIVLWSWRSVWFLWLNAHTALVISHAGVCLVAEGNTMPAMQAGFCWWFNTTNSSHCIARNRSSSRSSAFLSHLQSTQGGQEASQLNQSAPVFSMHHHHLLHCIWQPGAGVSEWVCPCMCSFRERHLAAPAPISEALYTSFFSLPPFFSPWKLFPFFSMVNSHGNLLSTPQNISLP